MASHNEPPPGLPAYFHRSLDMCCFLPLLLQLIQSSAASSLLCFCQTIRGGASAWCALRCVILQGEPKAPCDPAGDSQRSGTPGNAGSGARTRAHRSASGCVQLISLSIVVD